METNPKKILFIDLDDPRRASRVKLLENAGYQVELRTDWSDAEWLDHEGHFDLILIAVIDDSKLNAEYSDRLSRSKPGLPILLLTDTGVFVPPGTLSRTLEAGRPAALMKEIAKMLATSTHIRELGSE